MTTAREKIQNLANDRITPYRGSYVPNNDLLLSKNSNYDTKYILLFFYILIGIVFIMAASSN